MRSAKGGNRGATRLKLRRRATDPMHDFDALPPPLRRWVAQAARPWSPTSCLAIWRRALGAGGDTEEAIARLARAEAAMLARDAATLATSPPVRPQG